MYVYFNLGCAVVATCVAQKRFAFPPRALDIRPEACAVIGPESAFYLRLVVLSNRLCRICTAILVVAVGFQVVLEAAIWAASGTLETESEFVLAAIAMLMVITIIGWKLTAVVTAHLHRMAYIGEYMAQRRGTTVDDAEAAYNALISS